MRTHGRLPSAQGHALCSSQLPCGRCLLDACCAADLQSSKLKHVQEQNHSLTREKESLMQTIQDLKARIKQGVCQLLCCLPDALPAWAPANPCADHLACTSNSAAPCKVLLLMSG